MQSNSIVARTCQVAFPVLLASIVLVSLDGCAKKHTLSLDQIAAADDAKLAAKQLRLERQYHLGSYKHYHWSQTDGQLIFSNGSKSELVANIQFVGDISKTSNTWLWSWANSSVDENLTWSAKVTKAYGISHGLDKLTNAEWPADQADGWDMTAITAELTDAVGAYRSPDSGGYTFILITSIRKVASK